MKAVCVMAAAVLLAGCASPAERHEGQAWKALREERYADCAKLYGSAVVEFEEDYRPNAGNTPENRAAREGGVRALAGRARCLKEAGRLDDGIGELEGAVRRAARLAADAITPEERAKKEKLVRDLREDLAQWRRERR